jgi:hypothetical protein
VKALQRWEVAAIAAAFALFAGAALLREYTFHRLYFVTGWGLLLAIAFDLFRRLRAASGECEVGSHAALTILATSLFATHLELRVPNGWLEGALALLFMFLLSNAIMGSLVELGLQVGFLRPKRIAPHFARGWMLVHVPLTASLVALAMVHGVLVHGHGVIAYALLGH